MRVAASMAASLMLKSTLRHAEFISVKRARWITTSLSQSSHLGWPLDERQSGRWREGKREEGREVKKERRMESGQGGQGE